MQVLLNVKVINDLSPLTYRLVKNSFDADLPIEVIGTLHNFQGGDLYLVKAHTFGASRRMNPDIFDFTDSQGHKPVWEPIKATHTIRWVHRNQDKMNLFWLAVSRTLPVTNKHAKNLLSNFDD